LYTYLECVDHPSSGQTECYQSAPVSKLHQDLLQTRESVRRIDAQLGSLTRDVAALTTDVKTILQTLNAVLQFNGEHPTASVTTVINRETVGSVASTPGSRRHLGQTSQLHQLQHYQHPLRQQKLLKRPSASSGDLQKTDYSASNMADMMSRPVSILGSACRPGPHTFYSPDEGRYVTTVTPLLPGNSGDFHGHTTSSAPPSAISFPVTRLQLRTDNASGSHGDSEAVSSPFLSTSLSKMADNELNCRPTTSTTTTTCLDEKRYFFTGGSDEPLLPPSSNHQAPSPLYSTSGSGSQTQVLHSCCQDPNIPSSSVQQQQQQLLVAMGNQPCKSPNQLRVMNSDESVPSSTTMIKTGCSGVGTVLLTTDL